MFCMDLGTNSKCCLAEHLRWVFITEVESVYSAVRTESLYKTDAFASFNLLKPNDIYICRTAALTSRRYILNIYSTNIHTEYFKHAA